MTDTEINTSIAEACGWERGYASANDGKVSGARCGWLRDGIWRLDAPDYCHDLDAMNQAEGCKAIRAQGIMVYLAHLRAVVKRIAPHLATDAEGELSAAVFATARDRAEAFLRTIGKWRG